MPTKKPTPQRRKNLYSEEVKKAIKFLLAKPLILALTIVVILFLVGGGVLVVASYLSAKTPLVSTGFQRRVDYLIASVPGIPKTAKQIITKAAQDSQDIKTAKQKFVSSIKSADKEVGSLEITSEVDNTNLENTKLKAQAKGSIFNDPSLQLDLSLVEQDKYLYFKIDKSPPIPPYNLDAIKGAWYRINTQGVEQELGANIRASEEIKEDIENQQEKVFSFLEENKLFQKMKRFPDEKIGGRNSYHFEYVTGVSTLAKLVQRLSPGATLKEAELGKTIKEAKLQLWVDRKNFYINKLEVSLGFTTKVAMALSATGLPISDSLQAVVYYELSDINTPRQIEVPKGAVEDNSIYELYQKIRSNPSAITNIIPELDLKTRADLAEFGSNVLFIERLIHVVTVFPSSI